jgi:hypothetical protein
MELRSGAGSQFDPAVVDALEDTLAPGFQAGFAPGSEEAGREDRFRVSRAPARPTPPSRRTG